MKTRLRLFAVMVLLAGALPGMPVLAQTVYRCGNVYSQTPCAGGVALDASDTRTPAQKAQADAAATQAAKSADKLEKDRIALERAHPRKPPQKLTKPSQTAKDGKSEDAAKNSSGKKKKEPEYFTAAAGPNPKKSTSTSKESSNKEPVAGSDKPVKP